MEKNDFKAKIGSRFTVILDDGKKVDMELKEILDLKKPEGAPPEIRQEPFMLIFVGPNDIHLPDNTYTFSIEGIGEKPIFISAHKKGDAGIHYDAVFN